MFSLLRIIFAIALFLGISFGLSYSQPKWLAFLGMDFWKLPEAKQKLALETQREEGLNGDWDKFKEIAAQKNEILQHLIDSHLSLDQAAGQLEKLTPPDHLDMIFVELDLMNKPLKEGLYRVTIFWVQQKLIHDPSLAKVVVSRLETELNQVMVSKVDSAN